MTKGGCEAALFLTKEPRASGRRLPKGKRRGLHMPLTLYFHPLSSFCQKVLIALYENDTP